MIGLAGIVQVLPHRYPMLLIDQVVEHMPGERIVARKAISAGEPWYRADTPGGFGYPWPMLVESWCHAAGVLCAWDQPNPDVRSGQVMMFGSMTGVRFGRPVLPGRVVTHQVRMTRALSDTKIFEGDCTVDGEPVMELERIVMAMRPAGVLAARDLMLASTAPPHGQPIKEG